MKKRALITGIDGQDGYYLSRFLCDLGYNVFGIVRKKAQVSYDISTMQDSAHYTKYYADLLDFSSILECVSSVQPDEVYNLAGQSEIPISWRQPVMTANVDAVGVARMLEAIHMAAPQARFFQASSSEMFGANAPYRLDEATPFAPRNPYGTAKLFGHWITVNYRESYGMYTASGIMFNHESPFRGLEYVTRKITHTVAAIVLGKQDVLELGNMDAVRDWGHAQDYVRAMWLLLQQKEPVDCIIATGEAHTVREFVDCAFESVDIALEWSGAGLDTVASDRRTGKILVRVNPAFYRYPVEDKIIANADKLKSVLNFKFEFSFADLIESMVQHDLSILNREQSR